MNAYDDYQRNLSNIISTCKENIDKRVPKMMHEFNTTAGKRLEILRHRAGLSIKETAGILGINRDTYRRYELGDSPLAGYRVAQLAAMFNSSTDYIYGLKDTP